LRQRTRGKVAVALPMLIVKKDPKKGEGFRDQADHQWEKNGREGNRSLGKNRSKGGRKRRPTVLCSLQPNGGEKRKNALVLQCIGGGEISIPCPGEWKKRKAFDQKRRRLLRPNFISRGEKSSKKKKEGRHSWAKRKESIPAT